MISDLIYSFGIVAKREGLKKAIGLIGHYHSFEKHNHILLVGAGYNWDDSLYELYHNGFEVHHIRDITNLPRKTKFENYYQYFIRILKENNIRAILLSTCREEGYKDLQSAAKMVEVPIVSWQHGGGGFFTSPQLERLEYKYSDYHFVFGDGVKDSYETTCKEMGREDIPLFIPVGSATLDRLYRQYNKRKSGYRNVISYITTHCENGDKEFYDYDELYNVQNEILNRNAGCNIIVKTHPGYPGDRTVMEMLVSQYPFNSSRVVSTERTVIELAGDSDVMIFDVISTGILEAMLTNVTIKVNIRIQTDTVGLAKESAGSVHPCAIESLSKRAWIYGRDTVPFNTDTEFLKRFGTDIETLDSAQKAVDLLRGILSLRTNQEPHP